MRIYIGSRCDQFPFTGTIVLGSDVLLKSALSLAKAMCVREASKRTAEAAEFEAIDAAILAIEKEAKRLDEIRRWTETIKANSDKVLEAVRTCSSAPETDKSINRTSSVFSTDRMMSMCPIPLLKSVRRGR